MFKKLFLLLVVFLLLPLSSAAIFLIEPVDAQAENGSEVVFGDAAKGETIKVVVKKKSGLDAEWDTISVDTAALPSSWAATSEETDKTLIARIKLPKDAAVSTQRIKFILGNSSQPLFSESFYATVFVKDNLLTATIEKLSQSAVAGGSTKFKLILNNDSIAAHRARISSDLPSYWFQPIVVDLEPKKATDVNLAVNALSYGERHFSFYIDSVENDAEFSFDARLLVFPTLWGKYAAPLFGFPFFTPSLLPNYLINAFLALL